MTFINASFLPRVPFITYDLFSGCSTTLTACHITTSSLPQHHGVVPDTTHCGICYDTPLWYLLHFWHHFPRSQMLQPTVFQKQGKSLNILPWHLALRKVFQPIKFYANA